jgi:signal peptidase II
VKKYGIVFSVAAVVLILDQLTKWYIRQWLPLYDSVVVIESFFHITHLRNPGAAFGLLADADAALRIPFFIVVAMIAVTALTFFVRRIEDHRLLLLISLGAILGGAFGNLTDRILMGAVTDFLDFHIRGFHWPAFNVADSGISVGMVILILHSLFAPEALGEPNPPSAPPLEKGGGRSSPPPATSR